ncbi:unnamed protein product, partial [Mesorhabditis belari]|uniref:BRCT domain-containing protein n=1 Tax=Mesorhabditis belari TaxID=2138241 RepID=A0AAF3EZ15_9BILA
MNLDAKRKDHLGGFPFVSGWLREIFGGVRIVMGCAPSLSASNPSTKDPKPDRFAPPPPIPVTIGSGVLRRPISNQCIIFIFGGPGSQKGLVIEELVTKFDFVLINTEDIVFTYLPNKVSNTVESTHEIQDMLRKDAGVLSVDWVLSMVSARLSTSMQQRFIVDIVPSLNSFLKSESFLQGDHTRSMEDFERRHPAMFALELNLCNEEAILQNTVDQGQEKENGKKQLSAELNAFLKGIDEADKGRLERRMDLYHKCSRGFLQYFNFTKRIVRLDLYGMCIPNAVSTVSTMLTDFGFSSSRDEQRVILFSTGSDDRFEDIDLDFYKMRKVTLSHICKERHATLETQMAAVARYVARHPEDDHYALVLDSIARNESKVKRSKVINFMERKVAHLDDFIKERKNRTPFVRVPVSLNAITAPRDVVFLFLEPFPVKLASTISSLLCSTNKSPSNSNVNGQLRVENRVPPTPLFVPQLVVEVIDHDDLGMLPHSASSSYSHQSTSHPTRSRSLESSLPGQFRSVSGRHARRHRSHSHIPPFTVENLQTPKPIGNGVFNFTPQSPSLSVQSPSQASFSNRSKHSHGHHLSVH